MRAPLLLIAQDPATGNAVPGATARLRDDSVIPPADLDPSEIFTDRDGAGTVPANPVVTDANGMAMVFLERRQLRIEWSHGITTFVDVLPAGDGGIDAGAIDPAGLPPADALQEGVVGATDLTVTRNSSSQVTLDAGRIWIRTPAGVLVPVTLTGSTVLSGIPPATGSNKRLDQVTVDYTGTVRYRQGTTEATGVTIDNRTGAHVLPAGERVVEDLLITSSGVVAGAANMRDRRPWARGARFTYVRTSGNITMVTNATTPVDATNMAPRLELSGVPLVVELIGTVVGAASGTPNFALQIDGLDVAGALHDFSATSGGYIAIPGRWEIPSPSAGSHVIRPTYTSGQAHSIYADTTRHLQFRIYEDIRATASNGV